MAAEILSDKDAHLRNMRQHFRRLGNNRDVDVAERIAPGLNAAPCFAQQFAAIGAFKRRIGIGEQLADIAQRRGTKQRVGQRMQRDVAVGVGQQPFFIRNAYPANDDWAFTAKSVYVKTMSIRIKLSPGVGNG